MEPIEDSRGFFARSWCEREFAGHGLETKLAQCNVSFNRKRGTLRGLHFQAGEHAEVKLIRCTAGAIFDVIVDIRPDSPTFTRWFGVELTAENRKMLYVPEGFAHGLQTLRDDTEIFYQMSTPFVPESFRGLRWDDPAFGIEWPVEEKVISPKDLSYPDFSEGAWKR